MRKKVLVIRKIEKSKKRFLRISAKSEKNVVQMEKKKEQKN